MVISRRWTPSRKAKAVDMELRAALPLSVARPSILQVHLVGRNPTGIWPQTCLQLNVGSRSGPCAARRAAYGVRPRAREIRRAEANRRGTAMAAAKNTVGVVGLGIMGHSFAENLLTAGF